jgi:glycosyltransferase involved in cell wall biosynthesis
LKKLVSPVDLPNFPYKMGFMNRLCLGDAMYLFGLEKALKGFDIAHVRETYFHFTQQALNAKKKEYVKKVVCTCSETIPFNHEGIWNRRRFKRRAIEEVDLFHCLSEKAKKCLIKEGCNPKKIVVFPYGVDIDQFSPGQLSIGQFENSKINILFVGRLEEEKGVNILIKTIKGVVKSSNKVIFTIIGDGSKKAKIITLINQINQVKLSKNQSKKRIIFKKSVKYGEIANEYKKSDVFFLPSQKTKYWEEYLGMSIIEAMASGLPVVSTNTGAIPEVVNNAGYLLKPTDTKRMIGLLNKLIISRSIRLHLGHQARTRAVKYFDKDIIAMKIEQFWKKAYEKK